MNTENHDNKTTQEEKYLSAEQVEEAVISALLLEAGAVTTVFPVLKADMFSHPDMGFIYQAICNLYDQGEAVDMITVDIEMHKMDEKRWKEVGGIKRLTSLIGRIRHISGLSCYVEEVKRQYMLRLLTVLFATMGSKALEFGMSYSKLIEEAERSLLDLRERCTVGKPLERIGQTANEVLKMHRNRLETGVDEMRILSGIEEFDYVTGGLYKGELLVEGGRPSDGKTAVAMHIAMNVALSGKAVCFFSLEMTAMQTMNRLFAGYADVDANHLRIDGLTKAELERMERLAGDFEDLPLFFDHTSANSVENIRAQVMLQKKKGLCELVVVDYLHLMERKGRGGETMDQLVGRNIERLKQLAIDTNCPVLVLSQMNRNSMQRADKAQIPELHDLRDSGVIEQVADCVFFVYRPERHGIFKDEKTGESLRNVGKLYILKTRNGSTGIARFRYNESFTRITNYDNRMNL